MEDEVWEDKIKKWKREKWIEKEEIEGWVEIVSKGNVMMDNIWRDIKDNRKKEMEESEKSVIKDGWVEKIDSRKRNGMWEGIIDNGWRR